MTNVGDTVRDRLEQVDAMLTEKIPARGALDEEIKNLRQEKRELGRVIKQLDGTQRDGPVVSDEQVLEAVKAAGGEGVPGMRVAQDLGVTLRNVARKLRKLVDNGQLTGDPSTGYTVVSS